MLYKIQIYSLLSIFWYLNSKQTGEIWNVSVQIYRKWCCLNCDYQTYLLSEIKICHKDTVQQDGSGWKWSHLIINWRGAEIFHRILPTPHLLKVFVKYWSTSLFILLPNKFWLQRWNFTAHWNTSFFKFRYVQSYKQKAYLSFENWIPPQLTRAQWSLFRLWQLKNEEMLTPLCHGQCR
jgi:hypothetical protein